MTKLNLCLLLIVLPFYLQAQAFSPGADARFNNFSSQNHFTSRQILSITLDKNGYIWTSGTGVQRFDGYKTAEFSSFNPAVRPLKNNYAHVISDNDGRVWVSSSGLGYYDDASGKFVYIQPDDKKLNLTYAYAFHMQGNYLWFVCNHGLAKIDVHSLKISFTSLKNVTDPICSYMVEKNILLVSSRQKVYFYNILKNTYTEIVLTYNNLLVKIFSAIKSDGDILLGTTHGLFALKNLKDLILLAPEIKDVEIDDMTFLPDDKEKKHLYLATDGKGLMVYNTGSKKIETIYVHDENNPFSLPCNIIISLCTDNFGQLWMGTQTGISMLSKYNQQWKIRYIDKNNTDEQSITKIHQDLTDSSKVWMASENHGMICIDWKTKKIEKTYNTSPEMRRIADFTQISNGRWLLTNQKALIEWSPEKGVLSAQKLPLSDSLALGYYIRKIIMADRQTAYITTNKGLFKYDLSTKKITAEIINNNGENRHHADQYNLTNGFYNKGQLWIASKNGLFNYNIATHIANIYYGKVQSHFFMYDVAIAPNNKIICTTTDGLAIFNIKTRIYDLVNPIANVFGASCLALIIKNDDVLLGTEAGFMHYNLKTKQSVRVEGGNDLMNISPQSAFARIGDEDVVGFISGYTYFKPQPESSLKVSSPLIESFSVNDRLVINKCSKENLRFKYSDNSVNIAFTAFAYSNPDDIKFRYKLKGAGENWQYPDNQRSANYTQLLAGSYTFYVQSGDKNGAWNPHLAFMSFVITPPFWAAWWFRILMVLALAAILYQLYRYKIDHIRAIERIRQNIASDFHDDLGSTLSSISIFSEVAIQKTDTDLVGAKGMVGDIGMRARAMINSMNDMVWTIKPENDNLYKLMKRMEEFSYPVAEAKEIQLIFFMDESLYNIKTDMVRRKNLFLIFKEAFNNAVKYSGADNIQVTFKYSNKKLLQMQVTDNGCGFKLDDRRSGNGLVNMQKRVTEIKGKLKITTAVGAGTAIDIICKIA